jgi:predicted transcriptional regulator
MDEIAQILCWENFYSLKKLRKDTEVSDMLEMFPNCSFQIDWK